MLCLDTKISFEILDLDQIYCLGGQEFQMWNLDQILACTLKSP